MADKKPLDFIEEVLAQGKTSNKLNWINLILVIKIK
jgi:hypothetical protein